jgi:3-deoxy-D-manno-octulosonate 8-phosphate phosphatase (KDO 8-P phosphatase)
VDWSRIRLLILDVDGVLTDGRIIIDDRGVEQKHFDVRDGAGLKYWHRAGHASAILTGRESPAVARRAAELGIAIVRQNAKDKVAAYESILAEAGVTDEEVAYVGDDVTDLPVLRRVGFSVAVADGAPEARAAALYVTQRPGGRGAVREVIEKLLRLQGRWGTIMQRYHPA